MLERLLVQQNDAAQRGADVELDLVALRRVSAMCRALPALATPRFDSELAKSFNDGALLAYLTSLTRTLEASNAVFDRVNTLDTKSSHAGGGVSSVYAAMLDRY